MLNILFLCVIEERGEVANGWCDEWKRPHFRGIEIAEKICHVTFPSGGTSFLFVCEICRIKAETKNFFVNYNHCKGLSHCI